MKTAKKVDKLTTNFKKNLNVQKKFTFANNKKIHQTLKNTHKMKNALQGMYNKIKSNNKGKVYSKINRIDLINGKVLGKIPIEEFKDIRIASVHNVNSDSITLGKYTPTMEDGIPNWGKPGPDSYIGKSGKESTYFDLGNDWDKIKGKYNLSDDEMFEVFNVPVLDEAVKSGKQIRFSHKPDLEEYRGSFLQQEWNHLKEMHGFKSLKLKGAVWIAK